MYNWSVDTGKFAKGSKEALIWRLEQTINFGLNGEKLDKSLVRKYWQKLHLDPARKQFLKFLLWPKRY